VRAHFDLARRRFLRNGALVVTFALLPAPRIVASGPGAPKPVSLTEVDSFLAIDSQGHVTVYSGKVDLGTGLRTALAQIAAEELDLPLAAVTIVQGDTQLTPDQGPSYGSLSVQVGGVQIRQAAAAAKAALFARAATRFRAPVSKLAVRDGRITGPGGSASSYAALLGGGGFAIALDPAHPVETKPPERFTLVGRPVPRVDIPAKVTGQYTYMHDFRVPGMLHGRVVRPPALGAELQDVDETPLKGLPGIVRVVRLRNFLGVVATSEWSAIRAARALRATWTKWEGLPEQTKLFEYVRASKVATDETTSNVGDAPGALSREGLTRVEATYDFAIHTHGSIGPSCAIAAFEGGTLTCWSASQATHNLRRQLAKMLEMSSDDIHCVFVEGAGCYGRNGHEDAAADAALLARAVGKPVRVQWMRSDEHGWDPKGPPTLIDLKGAMNSVGEVIVWQGDFYIPQQRPPAVLLTPLLAGSLAGLPVDDVGTGGIGNDSNIPYRFANIKTTCHRLASTLFRPSWIRSPGRMQNTFANESFIDELAARAKSDPIAFRLKYLDPKDVRGIETLNRAAALAKWQSRASPDSGPQSGDVRAGRGVAYCKYELVRTYVAAVAEVEVTLSTGLVKVKRFFIAHDCGQIINPDGLANQIDGNIVQTMSRTLKEEVQFDRSMVTSLDWASYPILTFPEIPEVQYDLIDRPNEPPWGAGEPATAVVPGAISNAVFDATGVRLRSVPFTPQKVRAALEASGNLRATA
jgi:nicotinate dehydrogenase subunit B